MKDSDKTKEQVIKELKCLRQRIGKLEADNIHYKKSDAVMRKTKQKYQAILNAIPQLMFQIDKSGTFLEYKGAKEDLYVPADKFLGKKAQDVLPQKLAYKTMQFIEKTLQTNKTQIYEYQLPMRGKLRYYEARMVPCGKDVTLAVISDITRHKEIARRLKQSCKKLQKLFNETIDCLSSAVEKRDLYTAGHQNRVAILSCAIAQELHLPRTQIERLWIAGILHDIGKIYIPAEILSKPRVLTEIEFNIIKTHPELSCEILSAIKSLRPINKIILQHHERMDGSGYPQGLSGKAIFITARILGVADVVEAMASHRPYRPARGIDKALEEIKKNRGILYDSKIVDACVRLFTEKEFKFDE